MRVPLFSCFGYGAQYYIHVLVKAKSFFLTLTRQTKLTFSVRMKTANELCVSGKVYTLFRKNVVAIPHGNILCVSSRVYTLFRKKVVAIPHGIY